MSTQVTESQQQQAAKTFPGMLQQFKKEIAAALPKHLNADRMARIALTAFRRTPKLAECDPRSVFAAVIQASQLGLEPDTLGRSYLIPYEKKKNINGEWKVAEVECQFVPGWKGLVDLTNRAGNATTWTGAVFDGDEFDYALGDRPFVSHKPGEESDESQLTHVYAVGRVKGGEWPIIEVWTVGKVRKHRDKYNKVGKRHYSFENFEMYARKVVLLQVLKYMPASSEMAVAIGLNDAAEMGRQGLSIKDAIEGTWAPVPDTEENGVEEKAEKLIPFLSEEEFKNKKDQWKKLIQVNKKNPADIISMAETKTKLTDEQKSEITSWINAAS